jgi:hypothetical protein
MLPRLHCGYLFVLVPVDICKKQRILSLEMIVSAAELGATGK